MTTKIGETFVCNFCEEEWELSFKARSFWNYNYDTEENDFVDQCWNCHPSAVAGIVGNSVDQEELDDLPF